MLQEAGLGGQVVSLKIAGGFGSFIRVHSAEVIGLIPTDFAARAESIGNAAGAGASMLLLSRKLLDESEAFSRRAELVELSTNKYFVQAYTVNMLFPKQ